MPKLLNLALLAPEEPAASPAAVPASLLKLGFRQ
jgi:hypothetical protein